MKVMCIYQVLGKFWSQNLYPALSLVKGHGHRVNRSAVPAALAAFASSKHMASRHQDRLPPLSKNCEWTARGSIFSVRFHARPSSSCTFAIFTSLNPHSNPLKHLFLSFVLQVRLNYSARPFNYKLAEPEF